MTRRTRWLVVTIGAAFACFVGGCSPPSILPGSESTATLFFGTVVSGSPEGTRLESLHVAPLNGEGRLSFSPSYTLITVDHPNGTRSVVQTEDSLQGLRAMEAVDIRGTGMARVSIAVASGGPAMRIEDGYGNSLALTGIRFDFWVPAQGQAQLSDDWMWRVPMAGNTWDVARAQFNNVPAQTAVIMQFATPGGNISDRYTTGPNAGDILLSDFGDSRASEVSEIRVTFEPDAGAAH